VTQGTFGRGREGSHRRFLLAAEAALVYSS